jgi:hypothetical protein
MKKFIVCLIFVLAMGNLAWAQKPDLAIDKVREIRFLDATREDVKRILAGFELDDADEDEHSEEYSNDYVDVDIFYSSGSCYKDLDDDEAAEIWDVAEWKVTKIKIYFNDSIKTEETGFDLSKFKKKQNEAFTDSDIYLSKDLGITFSASAEDEIEKIIFFPPRSNYSKLCKNEKAEKFSASEGFYNVEFQMSVDSNYPANVSYLNLSATELAAECINNPQNKNRPNKTGKISVETVATDPENDVLTYNYEVSGGKIIGTGAKIVWDLTGVKPGTYTITAGADDGCGICGTTKTQTVIVREYPNCKQK